MALLSNWSATNREISEGKVVTYSISPVFGSWSYVSGNIITTITRAWEYHRYCSMSYAYVGMTYETALACAAAVVKNYTRQTRYSEFSEDEGTWTIKNGGSILMASVSVRLDGGTAYRVDVQVREDDSLTMKNNVSDVVAALFAAENARTYEEGDITTS